MKYRARVIFRTRVLPNESPGYWHAPSRMGALVSRVVHGWVMWEGSVSSVFHSNIQRVRR